MPSLAWAQEGGVHDGGGDSTDGDDPSSMSADQIFKRMFGKDRPPAASGRYPVIVDGMNSGEAMVDPNGRGSISSDFLKARIEPLLLPDAVSEMRGAYGSVQVSFETLRALGYEVRFDAGQLVLVISVPMVKRSARILPLNPPHINSTVSFAEQADLSAYASFRGGFDVVQRSRDGKGVSGFATDLDLGVNVNGIFAQARIRYDESAKRRLSRGDVRITYDDVSSLVRYELGDLSVNRRPFQVGPRIAGFSAYREYRINPYLDYRTSGEKAFELDTASRVEVVVNGVPVRTFSLSSGRYLLRDLPLVSSATNDVELRITGASGEQRLITFPAFTDIDLLDVGRTEFAVNAGLPYRDRDGVRSYDSSNFNLMGFFRRGFNQTLTAGLSLEADKDIALLGGEVSWASPIGTFNVNGSFDMRHAGVDSASISVQYALRSADYVRGSFADAQIILTGKDFRTLDRIIGGPPSSIFARARAGTTLSESLRVQVTGSYERVRDPQAGERWTVGGSAFRQIGRISLTGSLDYEKDRGRTGLVGRLSLFIPLGRGTLSSNFVSRDGAMRLDYVHPPAAGVGSFGYAAGAERRDGADRQYARASYVGNRFDASLEQTRTASRGDVDVRTGVSFGSAIVMADGMFAISRPISSSFAIVGKGKGVSDRLAIEPRSGLGGMDVRYSAFADALGPGVVPDLPSYYERQIEAGTLPGPGGGTPIGEVFNIKPGLRSGYRLMVGSTNPAVSMLGILIDRNAKLLSMASGEMRKVGASPDAPSALVFTNASGRFFAEGLEPGAHYDVVMSSGGDPERFMIKVPSEVSGIWRPVTGFAPLHQKSAGEGANDASK